MKKIIDVRVIILGWLVVMAVMLNSNMVKAASQDIAVNSAVEVTTTQKDYQFTIEQQGKVVLELTPAEGNDYFGNSAEIALYETDEDGNEVEIISKNIMRSETSVVVTPVRLSAGTYIAKYSSYYVTTAKLTIQYEEENPESFESEKNNGWSTANSIDLNKEYRGNLQTEDDVDYFKFQLEQEGSLYLNLRNIGTNNTQWTVKLFEEDADFNRNLIAEWTSSTNKNTKFTRYRLPIGTYYIKVSKGNYSTDDYKLGTTYVAENSSDSEIEYNNTLETANEIATNTEYKANISTVKDVDYYTFFVESPSKVQIKVRQENDNITSGLYNLTLYLECDDGTLIMYDRFNTIGNTVSRGNEVIIPEGKYVLYVKNNNGKPEDKNDYIFKIERTETEEEIVIPEVPQDVEGESGIPIAVNCTSLINTKERRYLFSIPKDGYVQLELTPTDGKSCFGNSADFVLYKIDNDGNEVEIRRKYIFTFDNIITIQEGLSSGTYIIKYSDSDMSTANLTIQYDEMLDLSKVVIEPIGDEIYNGEVIIPHLTVSYCGKLLKEKEDYTATYGNNICAGTATVTLNPVNDVSFGTQTTTFNIQKRIVSIPEATKSEFVYDGMPKQLIVDCDDLQYVTVENDTQINAGSYEASYILDTDNCMWAVDDKESKIVIPWTIEKATATLSVGTAEYTKNVGEPAFVLEGISTNSDGKIQYTVNWGADVATVNEAGQVTPLRSGNARISICVPETENYYASDVKTVNILIKDVPQNTERKNNSQIQKKQTGNARIVRASNTKGRKIALKMSGLSGCTGYEIQYGTKSNFKSAKIKRTVKNTVTLNKLKKGKKYYIRIRTYSKIEGKMYYGKWSSKKSVKVKK